MDLKFFFCNKYTVIQRGLTKITCKNRFLGSEYNSDELLLSYEIQNGQNIMQNHLCSRTRKNASWSDDPLKGENLFCDVTSWDIHGNDKVSEQKPEIYCTCKRDINSRFKKININYHLP